MGPVANPLKSAASSSSEYERNNAKKSRLNDDYNIEVKPEPDTLSANMKTESDRNCQDEMKYEDLDINSSADNESATSERRNVGKSLKLKLNSILKSPKAVRYERETAPETICRREKQIEYGKNTPEYANYLEAVPKESRQSFMPKTPNKHRKYSRRAWDGLIRQWRLNLHCWSDCPLEDLTPGMKLDDSFCSQDTNVSTSTSSSIADAFTNSLGIKASSKEDVKSASRKIFPEFDGDVDMKADIENIKVEPVGINEDLSNIYGSDKNEEVKPNTAVQEAILKSRISTIKREEDQVKKEPANTSWADEVDEYLKDEGLTP